MQQIVESACEYWRVSSLSAYSASPIQMSFDNDVIILASVCSTMMDVPILPIQRYIFRVWEDE